MVSQGKDWALRYSYYFCFPLHVIPSVFFFLSFSLALGFARHEEFTSRFCTNNTWEIGLITGFILSNAQMKRGIILGYYVFTGKSWRSRTVLMSCKEHVLGPTCNRLLGTMFNNSAQQGEGFLGCWFFWDYLRPGTHRKCPCSNNWLCYTGTVQSKLVVLSTCAPW